MTIAVMDSGIGGITVLNEAMKRLPNEEFVYFADTLHVPYGPKPKEDVRRYILDGVRSILEEAPDTKALVVACNTATSIAISDLRSLYRFPVIGMEPAVKPAVEMNRRNGKRVLVLATQLTLRESKYNELVKRVDDLSIVDSLPLPELVGFCERLEFEGERIESYFREQLSGIDLREYGTIVLGCTHYPFYQRVLTRLFPSHLHIIDGSSGTVKRLCDVLSQTGLHGGSGTAGGNVRWLCSDGSEDYIHKMAEALDIYSRMTVQVKG